MRFKWESTDEDRRAACSYHEHAVVGAKHLIIHIYANHRIGAPLLSTLFQLPEGGLAGVCQLLLIGAETTAEEVAQTGRKIPSTSTPEMTSPNIMPLYSKICRPSTEGVVVRIIVLSSLYVM